MKNNIRRKALFLSVALLFAGAGLTGCQSGDNPSSSPSSSSGKTSDPASSSIRGEVPSSSQNDEPSSIHEHTYADSWSYDEENHWHASTCGHEEVSGKEKHRLSETVEIAPTYTSVGKKKVFCSVCSYSRTENIDALEAQSDVITLKEGAELGKTYDKKPYVIDLSSFEHRGDGVLSLAYKEKGKPDSEYVSVPFTRAGEYTVCVTSSATVEWKETKATFDFTIGKISNRVKNVSLQFLYNSSNGTAYSLDNSKGALSPYGVLRGDEVEFLVDFEKNEVNATMSSLYDFGVWGKDADNYDFGNIANLSCKIVSGALTFTPPEGGFRRGSSSSMTNGVYRFTEKDGVASGDEVWFVDSTQDIEEIGTYSISSKNLKVSDPRYSTRIQAGVNYSLEVYDDEDFYLCGESFNLSSGEVVVNGVVGAGTLHEGDEVEVAGLSKMVTVSKLRSGTSYVESAHKNQPVSMEISGVSKEELGSRTVLCEPGTMAIHSRIVVDFHLNSVDEGGARTPLISGLSLDVGFYPCKQSGAKEFNFNCPSTLMLDDEMIMPGTTEDVTFALSSPLALRKGMEVKVMRSSSVIAGFGTIVDFLD